MRLRAAVGAVGVLATAVAAVAVLGTALAPVGGALDPLVAALSGLGPRGLVLASVAVVALGFLVSLLVPGEERVLADDGGAERFEELLDRPPEGVARRAPRTGEALDDDVSRAVAGNDRALARVRERLGDLAVAVLARQNDGFEEPAEVVATGAWTDDRTAAAFLAGPGGPVPAVRSRVRLWLDPETERERRIRRTADAIDALAADATPVGHGIGGATGESEAHHSGDDAGSERDRRAGVGTGREGGASVDAEGGRA
ncbi:MAG: hypothetical protein V5A28_11550 [Haloarculaceae archaeon]